MVDKLDQTVGALSVRQRGRDWGGLLQKPGDNHAQRESANNLQHAIRLPVDQVLSLRVPAQRGRPHQPEVPAK